MPLYRRLPKVGFTSRVEKPYVINVERIKAVAELDEITLESIKSVHKLAKSVARVKLIGASAKDLSSENQRRSRYNKRKIRWVTL